jgi:hypothetical protein
MRSRGDSVPSSLLEIIMKIFRRGTFGPLAIALALTGLLGSAAHAQTGKTRDQVQAEFLEAVRSGNIVANGESGLTLRELYPQRYPAVPAAGVTRAQVLAEFEQARRSGDILAAGDAGLPLNEVNPQAYPPKAAAHGKTRAQVEAELREALRTGNVLAGGDSGLLLNQLYPERYANVVPAAGIPMGAASSSEMLR